MAARRSRTQARRRGGNDGLPGWAWLVIGVLLAIAVFLAAPRLINSDGRDGFLRPSPNPDAQPAPGSALEEAGGVADPAEAGEKPAEAASPDYDFYTVLPGEEVALSDAQLAAVAREEQARREREQAAQAKPLDEEAEQRRQDAAELASAAPATTATTPAAAPGTNAPAAAAPATASAAPRNDTPYILQAGAFAASGDAEAVKARVALLGLSARVESATINGKTVYRVRMGPYATASELSEAKAKLAGGGLPALAIQVK